MRLIAMAMTAVMCAFAQGRPDAAAQKAAMEKFRFLAGTWAGEAVVTAGDGATVTISQTEEVQYRLDGLVLVIEGTGRDASGKVVFNAFAVVSFEPSTATYRIRAWNAGSFVETEIKPAAAGQGFEWGFERGPLKMMDRMTVDADGRWAETSEAVLADGRKVHSVRMLLSKKR